jgi:glucosamine--fructose-6-phosphate aminotransferase (isomerizing)
VVVKLIKYIYDKHKASGEKLSFQQLVAIVIAQLEGAFSLLFKSIHYPGELAASRRGSPLLVGVKCEGELATNHIPILFSKAAVAGEPEFRGSILQSPLVRPEQQAEAEFHPLGSNKNIEYYFASDASAVIEHTNQVIFLEDDDVAVVRNGRLTLHRVQKGGVNEPAHREIQALMLEIQQIMKVCFFV